MSFLKGFILLMLRFPDVQKRAQDEIDAHILPGHLPSFDDYDQESLPYVTAVMLELFRWDPVVVIGRSPYLSSLVDLSAACRTSPLRLGGVDLQWVQDTKGLHVAREHLGYLPQRIGISQTRPV